MSIKFVKSGTRTDGEPLYRLIIDGTAVRDGLTLDEVIEAINRRDKEKLRETLDERGGL